MEQTWRWYNPSDPASLADVHQVGATGVATALHHIPNGKVWSVEETLRHKTIVEDTDLVWSVVGNVPIYKDIGTHTGNCKQWTTNYQQALRNLAQCGICTVYYNSIPVLDWTHIDLEYVLSDGSKALRFNQIKFATFEMYVLKCPDAGADYIEEKITQTTERSAVISDEDKACLTRNITTGLPGTEEGHTPDQFRKYLELYKDIDEAELCENFAILLKVIISAVEEIDVRMAIHPDDPPRPVLGLPRIVSTIEGTQWMVDTINSMADGFTICAGSHGVRADNGLVDIIKRFSPRIYFTHSRFTMCEDNPKTSHETAHLNGDVDVYEVVKAIVEEEHRHKAGDKEDLTPICPNHGHQMLDDLKKRTNPGYSTIGRLKGLAEAHGVELVVQRVFSSHQYPPA